MALDFNPLEFFKEEIKSDDAQIKIQAVQRLDLIAYAMGNAKVVQELLPFASSVITQEPWCNDEEFLFEMAKKFAMLAEYCKGKEELLIPPLETLAAQEETVIRDKAVESMCEIVSKRPDIVKEHLLPTLNRLATKTDFFTARVSACALFPTAYKFVGDDDKSQLRKAYATICQDDTPMVRRAAAAQMKLLVKVCDRVDFLNDLLAVYKTLSQEDTQDTIRVASVHTTLVVATLLTAEENRQHSISVIEEASKDRSWRVRLTVAQKFSELCANFGSDITNSHLLACLLNLMGDQEHEVRKEAIKAIEPIIDPKLPHPLTSEQIQSHILPRFQTLTLDSAQPVRAALAAVLGPVAKALGKDVTQRQLLPFISDLMKDEFHDVRLNIVNHAGLICEVLSVDGVIHNLLHTIQSLIMDNHWRIRQSVVEQVPKLARLFGVEMFQSKLEALFLSSLRDSVWSVRSEAIKHLEEIVLEFGPQWTVEHLMPKVLEQYQQGIGYANRVTTLSTLPKCAKVMNAEQIQTFVVPLILKAMKDSVPNVRFYACKVLNEIILEKPLLPQKKQEIISNLQELVNDSDADVQYCATESLKLAAKG
jgi:serine/threonine-protein phosphatase 2A regulatory subunit A